MEKRKTDISELADLLNDLISPTEALFADIQGQIAASFSKERLSRNLSQKQFAELIGASQSQVSKWESGDFNFTINTLVKFAIALEKRVTISFSDLESVKKTDNSKIVYLPDSSHFKQQSYRPVYGHSITEDIQEG